MSGAEQGRRRHYAQFYGLEGLPDGDGGPRLAVYGNCQAEALRVSIATSGAVRSVRMPPVHELTEDDLPHLERLLGWVDVLVAQAIGEGYRGLPLGTREVAARLGSGQEPSGRQEGSRKRAERPFGPPRLVPAPNYFSTVLYPEQVLVRHEDPGVVDPPVVPYHDVRRIGAAAGWKGPWQVPAEAVRSGAAASMAELERREAAQGSLVISDVVRASGARAGWTVDHPGNPVLLALAQRVVDEIGVDGVVCDPGRELLSSVLTPLRPEVLAALGLDGEPRAGWVVGGEPMSEEAVGAAHEEFYASHPRVVEVGIEKKGAVLRDLGWRP